MIGWSFWWRLQFADGYRFKVSTLKVVTKETEDSEKVIAKRARKGHEQRN